MVRKKKPAVKIVSVTYRPMTILEQIEANEDQGVLTITEDTFAREAEREEFFRVLKKVTQPRRKDTR